MKYLLKSILIASSLSFLIACGEQDQQQIIYQAQAIESADECHLCGMLITNFSGPKGELYREDRGDKVHKFCSTRDMFSFYLDPENKRNVTTIYVHDMSKMPWDEPDDGYFIDAKTAWFVVGSEKTGAMGKTLASFSQQSDALAFAQEFGGEVLDFNQVDQASLM
ncbi:nitrous oxide reductase accessory protein NosL [Thalassotalea psychrophila]|uniref:Nitrous oxide reductase accessory protein NosL n=1 Tax=Thalassotalea psychrophila TaxID=3065647 RepID=A0ABY9TU13_9GAMM|nr:nitrous oxide reductase accessory protein NosL [Colwelliaceae bacterium SQ149]